MVQFMPEYDLLQKVKIPPDIIFAVLLWALLSGIDGFSYQTGDFQVRNLFWGRFM